MEPEKAIRVDVCQLVVLLLESSYSPVQSFPSTFCISESQLSFMEEDSFCPIHVMHQKTSSQEEYHPLG
eukprot:scaffold8313_cov166-Ochromonas_danica.AAC.1